jgi:Undecaprenyl-phosphate glucose phosphotransferase
MRLCRSPEKQNSLRGRELDYRDATSLCAHPAKPMGFPIYQQSNDSGAKLSKRLPSTTSRSSFKISVPVLQGVVRIADVVVLLATVLIASCFHPFDDTVTRNQDILAGLIAAGVAAQCLRWGRCYTLNSLRSVGAQARVSGAALAVGVTAMCFILLVMKADQPAERTWALDWLLSAAGLFTISRLVLYSLMRRWEREGCFTRSVAIVGDIELGYRIAAKPSVVGSDHRVVGVYEDGHSSFSTDIVGSFGYVDDLIIRCRQEPIDTILIAVPTHDRQRIANLSRQLSVTVSDIYLAAGFADLCPSSQELAKVANEPAVLLQQRPLKDWEALQKRAFDIAVASLLLVFLAPFMGLIALFIKLDSPGPVFFLQPRFGFNNNLFNVYKFRTMHHDMADKLADQQTKKNDKRITRVGKWLRKLSLDELPQLQNVLMGDMSLVGPRPHAPNTKAAGRRFTEIMAEQYALRHRVKPGITGWAQVNGWRGETQTIENRVACDLHYIDNWSLFFDAKILLLTLRRGITSPQAY